MNELIGAPGLEKHKTLHRWYDRKYYNPVMRRSVN
jgi:hypothetical protein